jgi:drug/metabolite transporter (DMT)-like permease
MDDSALTALVLLAAVLHASWNALVKAGSDKLVMQTLVILGAALAMGVALPFLPFPARASWPYLALSTVLHLTYNVSLVRAYQRGDLSQVYPIARGAAPAFVALGAWWALGEGLGAGEIAGVALLSGGIVSLALGGTRGARADAAPADGVAGGAPGAPRRGSAVAWSLLTAAWIGAYSVSDGAGVRSAGNALSYVAWLTVLDALPLLAVALWVRRARLWPAMRPHLARGLAGGALSAIAYGIVLWAMTRLPIAHVAALRETSVIFAAAVGTMLLGEPFGRRRLLAAALVAAGAVVLRAG